MAQFHDHFSGHAKAYAQSRPDYPRAMFAWLATLCHQRDTALDVACGNGQAAVALAQLFDTVHACDASSEQIANAMPARNVTYKVARCDATGIRSGSVDLLTVAQALHWFDLGAFLQEARRVIAPGGVLAVWCYGLFTVSEEVDSIIRELYDTHTDSWWPAQRAHIDDGYARLHIPGQQTERRFAMSQFWTVGQGLAYLRTWSAVQRALAATGTDLVSRIEPHLRQVWTRRVRVCWPLTLKWVRSV